MHYYIVLSNGRSLVFVLLGITTIGSGLNFYSIHTNNYIALLDLSWKGYFLCLFYLKTRTCLCAIMNYETVSHVTSLITHIILCPGSELLFCTQSNSIKPDLRPQFPTAPDSSNPSEPHPDSDTALKLRQRDWGQERKSRVRLDSE